MMERIDKLREFLKESPDDGFLNHALALEYVKLGQIDMAREAFERLLSNDPDYVGSYYHLAKLLESTGQVETALKWYEKGIETARRVGDRHALGELQAAYDDLAD
jgi:tetratricopeptide (TPR) repeat protein